MTNSRTFRILLIIGSFRNRIGGMLLALPLNVAIQFHASKFQSARSRITRRIWMCMLKIWNLTVSMPKNAALHWQIFEMFKLLLPDTIKEHEYFQNTCIFLAKDRKTSCWLQELPYVTKDMKIRTIKTHSSKKRFTFSIAVIVARSEWNCRISFFINLWKWAI